MAIGLGPSNTTLVKISGNFKKTELKSQTLRVALRNKSAVILTFCQRRPPVKRSQGYEETRRTLCQKDQLYN